MKNERNGFTHELKKQVRREQKNLCACCGTEAHLTIHHIIPLFFGGDNTRENALGLKRDCHDRFDRMAFEHRKYYDMKEGKWYPITKGY